MKKKVLFICVHNSARSQMAAAWLNDICGDYFEAQSAGLEPGQLNPLAVQVMDEIGIDISNNKTQAVFDVLRAENFSRTSSPFATSLKLQVVRFSRVLRSDCIGVSLILLRLPGHTEQRLEGTRKIRDDIQARIEAWCDEMCAVDA